MSTPTQTPNVVVQNPNVRKAAGIILGAAGIILGTAVVVDGATAAFDIAEITTPITAGYLCLSSLFDLAVTVPNVPTPRSLLRRDLR
ncbi:hypothetical protein [Microbacterium sp.]|uniref:hypothetical protein n=1 Tax=Microbacterium sp. TaxID=51671 RepID=UPI003563961A